MTTAARNVRRKEWAAVVLLIVVGAVCARAGLWQLHRAAESRAIEAALAEAEAAPPLDALPSSAEGAAYRSIELEGRYVPERQFLLDNAVMNGRPGYFVLTPFDPVDTQRSVIVNRGWVPGSADRSVLPRVPVDGDRRTIRGRLAPLPAPGIRLGAPDEGDANEALAVLSYPTMADLERRLGRPLFGLEVQLDGDQPDGFARQWSAPVVMSPTRHLAYVGQWWVFAALAFGIAGVLAARELRWRKG
ncbi:MAG TPA: SURF1 family protein [Gammaproteobacteria bacterium]|nr:SURF1 family protein [Gammaproteobacteria bacterium]